MARLYLTNVFLNKAPKKNHEFQNALLQHAF